MPGARERGCEHLQRSQDLVEMKVSGAGAGPGHRRAQGQEASKDIGSLYLERGRSPENSTVLPVLARLLEPLLVGGDRAQDTEGWRVEVQGLDRHTANTPVAPRGSEESFGRKGRRRGREGGGGDEEGGRRGLGTAGFVSPLWPSWEVLI